MNTHDRDTLCRQIVESAGDAIIFADRDGIIRLWNRAAEGIFGYTEAEAVGQSLDLIIPERQREAHWKGYARVMLDGVFEKVPGQIVWAPTTQEWLRPVHRVYGGVLGGNDVILCKAGSHGG